VADNSFFDETREQSAIKAEIVADYFWAWAKIIGRTVKGRGDMVAYIDLFAGPGCYRDGSASTPLLVLQKAIGDPELAQLLVSVLMTAMQAAPNRSKQPSGSCRASTG